MSIKQTKKQVVELWLAVGKDKAMPRHIRRTVLLLLQIIHDYILVE